jgi:hypothetical protein
MRSITLALVVAFATATRLTAIDATIKDTTVKSADVAIKPLIGDIKPIDKIEKPLDLTAPGAIKKDEKTLEDSKEEGSKSAGCL